MRVWLPFHLRTLAHSSEEVELDLSGPVTQKSVLDKLESDYPVLKGTIRDHGTLARRPFLRFFANGQDITCDPPDKPLPPEVTSGAEPFMIIGAIAGG